MPGSVLEPISFLPILTPFPEAVAAMAFRAAFRDPSFQAAIVVIKA